MAGSREARMERMKVRNKQQTWLRVVANVCRFAPWRELFVETIGVLRVVAAQRRAVAIISKNWRVKIMYVVLRWH